MVDEAVRIDLATAADCEDLAAMLRQAFDYHDSTPPPEMESRLRLHLGQKAGLEALIARLNEKPCGFAIFSSVFWTRDCLPAIYLKELFVTEFARGRGLGGQMMSKLADLAIERGWSAMVWTLDPKNRSATDFYGGIGGIDRTAKELCLLDETGLHSLAAKIAE